MGELNLRILGIKGAGNLADERLVLLVTNDDNLGNYMVSFVREIGNDTISAKLILPMWFPDVEVKANDKIVVYTRSGKRGKKESGGGVVYFYYRNNDEPICTSEDIGSVIFRIDEWRFGSKRL